MTSAALSFFSLRSPRSGALAARGALLGGRLRGVGLGSFGLLDLRLRLLFLGRRLLLLGSRLLLLGSRLLRLGSRLLLLGRVGLLGFLDQVLTSRGSGF